ncbi:MAG: hypothetical protein LUO89_01270 [Methanothrix sp.]|nr:hypothetical protein [Methanothrix sp.]
MNKRAVDEMATETIHNIQKEKQMNWGIKLEDLLSILVLLIMTLGIATYLQYIISNGLENAEYISKWLVSP